MTAANRSSHAATRPGARTADWRVGVPKASRGLTLIELMVALTVFAILGTLTYRGTNEMFTSNQHIERELERWREINRAFQIIESELFQVVAPQATPAAASLPPMSLRDAAGSQELRFLSLAGGGPERIGFVFQQQRIDWTRQAMGVAAPVERDTLIEDVADVRWLFLSKSGWVETWPVDDDANEALPSAVGLELTLPEVGTVSRIYALR